MSDEQFKYDVAFSFCQEDEPQALELNDLIQDRFSTFLYSKRQETLAGTDGEESFSRVFATEARFVVVFFRERWGKTPFTRIEETAIRNRAYSKGYDFTLFIPREQQAKVPDWVPKPRLWYDWPRWGVKGAASVIEARIAELGARPREESVLDHAARMQREIEFQKQRRQFADSPAGVSQSDESFYKIAGEFERLRDEMATMGTELSMQVRRHGLSIARDGLSARPESQLAALREHGVGLRATGRSLERSPAISWYPSHLRAAKPARHEDLSLRSVAFGARCLDGAKQGRRGVFGRGARRGTAQVDHGPRRS